MTLHAGPSVLRGLMVGTSLLVFSSATWARSAAGAENESPALRIEDNGKTLTVRQKADVMLRYRYADVPFKPCVAEWHVPGIGNILRDSAPDHKHHHALMFAWNVDGVEFWGEDGPVGRQLHKRFTKIGLEPGSRAVFVEDLDWVGPDGKVLLREQRRLTIPAECGPADRLITWRCEFVAPDTQRDVTLMGRKYFGLGVRFLSSMDRDGRFLTATGETAVDKVNGSHARWCAFANDALPGKPVTFALFDDPGNVRYPAKWFAMNQGFAYMTATIGVEEKPFVLKGGQRLVLQYGVAAWAAAANADRIESAYRMWQDSVKPDR